MTKTNDFFIFQKINTLVKEIKSETDQAKKQKILKQFLEDNLQGKFTHAFEPIDLIITGILTSTAAATTSAMALAIIAVAIPVAVVGAVVTAIISALPQNKKSEELAKISTYTPLALLGASIGLAVMMPFVAAALGVASTIPAVAGPAVSVYRGYQTFFDKKPTGSEGETQELGAGPSYS